MGKYARYCSHLERLYEALNVEEDDRRLLAKNHRITSYWHLVRARDRLERLSLKGVTDASQFCLAEALRYLDTIECGRNPVDHFDKWKYHEFLLRPNSVKGDRRSVIAAAEVQDAKRMRNDSPDDGDDNDDDYVPEESERKTPAGDQGPSKSKNKASRNDSPEVGDDNDNGSDVDFFPEEAEESLEEIEGKLLEDGIQLALQGIGSGSQFRPKDDGGDSSGGSKSESTVSLFEFGGTTFRAGRCYNYRHRKMGGGSGVDEFAVAIQYINPAKEAAKCVLVWRKSETFLGKLDLEAFDRATKRSEYVQVRADVRLLPLSNFAGEFSQQPTVPKLVYMPQLIGSARTFGYFLDIDQQRNRCVHRRKKLRVLELYSGAGGMHQGFKAEGFETAAVVDVWPVAMETFRLNNPGVPRERTFTEAVKDFVKRYKSDKALRELIGPIDVIHLSPPCKGFSGANIFGGKNDEKNREQTLICIEAVRAIHSSMVTFEMVVGIWCKEYAPYIAAFQNGLLKMGYQFFCSKVDSCDYGSPQRRPRFIIVAAKNCIPLSPRLLLEKPYGDGPDQLPYVTVRNVLQPLRNAEASQLFPNMRDTKTTSLRAGESKLVKLVADGLEPTVRGGGVAPLHFAEDRCISVREAAALQGFANDYAFPRTTLQDMYEQIGNAVPFELSCAIARMVKETLKFEYQRRSNINRRLKKRRRRSSS